MLFDLYGADSFYQNGIKFTTIPKDISLFRGDNNIYDEYSSNTLLKSDNNYKYFGLTQQEVEEYGVKFQFITTKDLHLIRLDDDMTRKTLHKKSSTEIQRILKRNFGHNEGNIRYSDPSSDDKMSKHICSQFDGYITDNMSTDASGTFHREIMICNPNNSVDYVKQLSSHTDAAKMREEYKLKLYNIEEAKNRKKKGARMRDDSSMITGSALSFDVPLSPPRTPPRTPARTLLRTPPRTPTNTSRSLIFTTPTGGKKQKKTIQKCKNSRKKNKTRRTCKIKNIKKRKSSRRKRI